MDFIVGFLKGFLVTMILYLVLIIIMSITIVANKETTYVKGNKMGIMERRIIYQRMTMIQVIWAWIKEHRNKMKAFRKGKFEDRKTIPHEDHDIDACTPPCHPECPNLFLYRHPYWKHTAFCSHRLVDLTWYEGDYLAICEVLK